MRRLLIGAVFVLLIISAGSGLVYLAVQVVQDVQHHADWEINFMRMICIITVVVFAIPSIYTQYQKTTPSH